MAAVTTYINFVQSAVEAPNFQVTLDGETYLVVIPWNMQAQRYYINIYTINGTLVLSEALVGSQIGIDLEAVSWANGFVTITTDVPHMLTIGDVVNVSVVGVVPDAYNGLFEMLVTGPLTLRYQLATNPGDATVFGAIQQNINLIAGLFTDTMVYRQANSQFEITSTS